MPAINFLEYVQGLRALLDEAFAAGDVVQFELQVDQRSAVRGLIAGDMELANGGELHFREFLDVTRSDPRLMYAYHYQDVEHQLIFRYDNAVHRPRLPQRAHKHLPDGVYVSPAPTLLWILDEIFSHL